jgi:hypothetical protein
VRPIRIASVLVLAAILLAAMSVSAQISTSYDLYDLSDDAGVQMLVQDIDHHFYLARVDLEEKKYQDTAADLRTTIPFVELEANRAEGKEKSALENSILELKQLADRLDKGEAVSEKELHEVFSRTQFALAMNSWVKASESFQQKHLERATRALHASQLHLQSSIEWAKQKEEGQETAKKSEEK